MPEILTKYFGAVEYRPEAAVRFPRGLPAFEQEKDFLLLEPAASAPVVFLQSLHRPELCFLALPMAEIAPDYRLAITEEDLESLGLPVNRQPVAGEDVSCLAIVVTENGRIHANLLAPVVVNSANRLGLQAIRVDSLYSHRHPVAERACL